MDEPPETAAGEGEDHGWVFSFLFFSSVSLYIFFNNLETVPSSTRGWSQSDVRISAP